MRNLVLFLTMISIAILITIHCDKKNATGPEPEPPPDPVTDIDGNVYQTVKIGDQIWMAENLKVTHYRNGQPILYVEGYLSWAHEIDGAYCNYNNDEGNAAVYGCLYNWYAVNAVNEYWSIAPEGWHVPTVEEWQTLIDYLGDSVAGGKMKAIGTIEDSTGLWREPNTGATNKSGFTALPGGRRGHEHGYFREIGEEAWFWTSTEGEGSLEYYYGQCRILDRFLSGVDKSTALNTCGFSVRLVRD